MHSYGGPEKLQISATTKNLSKEQVKAALKNMALHSAYWGKVDDYEWIDGSTTRACTWLQNVLITVDEASAAWKGKLNFHKSRILEDIVKMYDTPLGNKLYHEFCDGKNWLTDDDTLAALFAFRKRLQDDDSARNRVIQHALGVSNSYSRGLPRLEPYVLKKKTPHCQQ